MKAFVAALLVGTAACSGQSQMTGEQLASENRQLRSIAAEVGLLEETDAIGHLPQKFARGHAENLRQTLADEGKKLDKATAPANLDSELERLRRLVGRLERRLDDASQAP